MKQAYRQETLEGFGVIPEPIEGRNPQENGSRANLIRVKASKRTEFGTSHSRRSRIEGKLPAVIKGWGLDDISIDISLYYFSLLFTKQRLWGSSFEIFIDGVSESQVVAFKSYEIDPVSRALKHVEFVRIGTEKPSVVRIPIHYVNSTKSTALKKGAFINIPQYYLDIRLRSTDMPTHFEIDLTGSDVNFRAYAKSLTDRTDIIFFKGNQLCCNFIGKRGKKLRVDSEETDDEKEESVNPAVKGKAAPAKASPAPTKSAEKPKAKKK